MELGGNTKAVLLTAGLIFIWALLLGVWKYRQKAASSDGEAHAYVDTRSSSERVRHQARPPL